MERIATLVLAFTVGFSAMMAGTLTDVKDEIAKIDGVTCIDASEEPNVQEFSINNCKLIMLTPEIMDKVKPVLTKIPEALIFADVNDEEDTMVTVWAEPDDGSSDGELLIFVDAEDQLLLLYTHGNLEKMLSGIHID